MNAVFDIARDHENFIECMDLTDNAFGHHFHSNLEIALVLEGEIEITINGLTRVLTKGCVSAANSYDIHCYYTRSHSRIRLLIIPIELVRQMGNRLQTMTFASPFLNPCEKTGELQQAMAALLAYGRVKDCLTASGYVFVVLGILADQLSLSPRRAETGSTVLMQEMLAYLEQNYLTDISLVDLARRYGYHKNYLSRVFNARLGCGFRYYINTRRAQYAARLMQTTDLSLEEIAFRSGFHNLRTFNRAFQSCFQQTARQYRKAAGQ